MLVVGSGPGEWLLIGPAAAERDYRQRRSPARCDGFATVVDLTHGRALLRLTG